MKAIITISAMILFVMAGCGEKQSTEDFITVDVTKSYPKKELILQDFMDVEYIPLETSDEFLTAGNIQAIGKEIIILRNTGRTDGNIFIFDRKGKGLKKINRLGQGGEEYTNILRITLDEEKREMFINNHYSSKVLVYDLMGNFKRSFKQREGFFYDEIGNYNSDYLICHDGLLEYRKPDLKRNFFMIVSKQDGSIKDIPIPYKEKLSTIVIARDAKGEVLNDRSIRNKQLIPYQDSWILIEPSSDTIYSYSRTQTIKPFIVRTPSVQVMNPEVFLFPGVITERYCFIQTIKKEYNFTTDNGFPQTDLMYDRQEKAVFECVVYNDDFTDKRPMDMILELFTLTIVNNDEIAFTRKLDASDLVEAYEKGKLKGKLKDIAAELHEESNPVIMLAKYKK